MLEGLERVDRRTSTPQSINRCLMRHSLYYRDEYRVLQVCDALYAAPMAADDL
jgi:hypothetical protein